MEQVISLKTQKKLGEKGLIFFIIFLSLVIPLSTDIYLPALPKMAVIFNDTKGLVSYTLIGFFIFFGLSTLVWGPISDKYGRKPILTLGIIIYTIGSILCVIATSVYSLIIYRIIQPIGGGAIVAIAGAIVKDSFEGKKRESVMAFVQSMSMIAPLLAPILGAFLLKITSWRGLFVALASFGILAFIGVLLFEESNDDKHEGSVISSIGRLVHVAKNPNFSSLMIIFLLSQIGNMAFVSASAYIYVNKFHLSEQAYSFFFAANAFFLIIGPLFYIKMSKYFSSFQIVVGSFAITTVSGILVCGFGLSSPFIFAIALIPTSFFSGVLRPLGTNLMFNQQKGDAGSASSLMNFTATIFGTFGMFIASLNKIDNVILLGALTIITSIISIILWFPISKKITM